MSCRKLAQQQHSHREGGFTLVEMMTTLVVAGILLASAVPSMQDFITRNRMSIEVNTFVASLNLARSEAVKRIENVSLCPTTDFNSCSSDPNGWNLGWMVYANNNTGAGFNSGQDIILQRNPSLPSRFTVDGTVNYITYNPTGQANGSHYLFCDNDGVAQDRNVVVSPEGRVRVEVNTGGCS